MAAVFLKCSTEKGKTSSRDHCLGNKRRTNVEEFLRSKNWNCIGNQGFYSKPSFSSAKDQLLAQANALRDIENLLKWKPSLKETLKDSVIIVGQVYDLESLMENASVPPSNKTKEPQGEQPLIPNLESRGEISNEDWCSQDKTAKKQSVANAVENIKTGQTKLKTRIATRPGTTRPARVRSMGSAAKVTSRPLVNFPKKPVKTTNGKNTTSMLLPGRCPGDINSNHLSEEEYGENKDDDMTPLYLTCLEEDEASDGKMAACACGKSGYHVETFVKGESCARNMCCANINVDPSERVVV